MLIVTVAVAAAIGYGTRAASHIQSLLHKQDVRQAGIIVFAAVLAIVPLAFVLAVRLGQFAIRGPRRRTEKSQPSPPPGDEPVA